MSEVSEAYDFASDFQAKLVALTMRHFPFVKRTSGLVKPQYFENQAHACLVDLAARHYEKYDRTLTDVSVLKEVLIQAINDNRIPKNLVEEVKAEIRQAYSADLSDSDFYVDAVAKFARNRALTDAIMKSVDYLDRGDFDKIKEAIDAASKVGTRLHAEAYDFYDEAEKRYQIRVDMAAGKIRPSGIPTGIREFDALLHHKGLGRKELTVFMAGAKRGKTLAIWDFGQRVAMQGFNVVGITLEVSKEIISDRLDANISGVPMSQLSKRMGEVFEKLKAHKERVGKFDIYEFPASTFKPSDLERIVEEYESKGVPIDLLVVDYLDIMAPDRWMPDKIENSKTIWTGVRDIAKVHNLAVLSATQTNRDGMKRTVADDTDVSEDINKIRIADLVISINATEDELAAGESRLFFAASRNQKGKMTVRVKNDLECQRFITEVLEIM